MANESIDFFASGHPLVEGIFAHYEDSALGRAVRFAITIGTDSGAGLVAIYKDGRAFEVVAIDAAGNARPDWAAAVCQRPIVVRPVTGEAARDRAWRSMVRRLGAQFDPTRGLHAIAAIEVRPSSHNVAPLLVGRARGRRPTWSGVSRLTSSDAADEGRAC